MFGTVIIRPSDGSSNRVWDNGTSYLPGVIRMGVLQFEVVASNGRSLPVPCTTTEQLCAAGE